MALTLPIYLDYHATTPVDPRVLDAMLPYFSDRFGNAASRSHKFGWEADAAVERAREQAASLIGASGNEIIFTSGATESNNLAIQGVLHAHADRPRHVVTPASSTSRCSTRAKPRGGGLPRDMPAGRLRWARGSR